MANRLVSVDSTALQFPTDVRETQAANFVDQGTLEGAALAAQYETHLRALFNGTDETATLQAAVTAAAGGRLRFPPGKTLKSQSITVPAAGVSIDLNGSTINFIDPGAVGGTICLFRAESVEFFEIEGGKLEATNATGRTSVHGLLRVKDTDWLRVQHMQFGKSSSTAIHTWNVAQFVIDDVDIVGTYADGVHLSRGTSNGTVSRIRGRDTGDDLVAINSYTPTGGDTFGACENITIRDVKGWNVGNGGTAGRGVVVNGGVDVTVKDVYIDGVAQAAVLVSRDSGMFDPSNVHVDGVVAHNTGLNPPGGGTTGAVYVAHLTGGTVKNLTGTDTAVSVASTASAVVLGDRPRVFIPTSRMVLATGGPAQNATSTHRIPVWLFDAASDESISFTVDGSSEMRDWQTMRVELLWANAAAGAGDVSWRLYGGAFGAGDTLAAVAQVGSATVTALGQDIVAKTQLASAIAAAPADDCYAFRLYRVATAGSDTLANDAAVLGVILTRLT